MAVSDATNSNQGFKDGNTTLDDYTYDPFGNLTTDKNKSITYINYNHLNLPTVVVFENGSKINYFYDANGKKVAKVVNGTTRTDYCHGFQYVNNILKFFAHAEGYVNAIHREGNYAFDYAYHYTDHLGNVRLTYGLDKRANELKILEENHYYPFGLRHTNYNTTRRDFVREQNLTAIEALQSPLAYKYKYNGKEWQDELGLNFYDYGARNYDPAIGRWMNIDPLAEAAYDWTPYRYAYNNPLKFTDPDGMLEDDYGLDDNGNIKLIQKTNDKNDRLFAVDDKGNKKDVNGSGSVNNNDSVEVGKGILNQMTSIRAGSENNVEGGYTSAIAEQSPQAEKDYKSIFKFAADNSSAEFSLTSFSHKGKDYIQLSTFGDSGESPSPFQLGISNPNKNVSSHMHSHPDIRTIPDVENYSMGGDYRNAKADNRQYPNKVYFPNSSRLYQVTTQGTQFIKKVKSSKDF